MKVCAFCSAREGVSSQVINTFKASTDPDDEPKKNRILHLDVLADGNVDPLPGDPDVVICFDEFGPLNLQPHPGKHWAVAGGGADPPRRTRRASSASSVGRLKKTSRRTK